MWAATTDAVAVAACLAQLACADIDRMIGTLPVEHTAA